MLPNKSVTSRRPRRYIKVLIVFVILAAVGLLLTNRNQESIDQAGTPENATAPVTNKPTTAGGALYNAICSNAVRRTTSGTLKDSVFSEVSGITASRSAEGTYWVHNDSGDKARIYAVAANGKLLETFELPGITAVDWEDIASGPGPAGGTQYLYVADTGDNSLSRGNVEIYRFPEPVVTTGSKNPAVSGVEVLTFDYPDKSGHNVEAMFIDPTNSKLYLIDKSDTRPGQVYEGPDGLRGGSRTTLSKAGDIGYKTGTGAYELITSADISQSGDTIAIRTYDNLYVYNRPAGSTVTEALAGAACSVPKFSEDHGEAVAFTRDGHGLVTTSEGSKAPIHLFTPR